MMMRYSPSYHSPAGLGSPGIFGDIWGTIKKLPGEIKKIDVKDVEKLGGIVGAFRDGKKGGGKGGGAPIILTQPPPSGVDVNTILLLMAGGVGVGLVLYLLLRK